jgi:hypothetical protein
MASYNSIRVTSPSRFKQGTLQQAFNSKPAKKQASISNTSQHSYMLVSQLKLQAVASQTKTTLKNKL